MNEKKTKENGEYFRVLVCYFFNENKITGQDAGLEI